MSTYGQLKLRLTQAFPGIPLELVEGWFADRYGVILDRLEWQRQHKEGWLQTVAYYETGTLAVSSGGTALTGTDTVWTSGMTGRRIRIAGRDEWYTFTRTGATTGTLDRAYEADDDETEATYRIYQPLYTLPSDCKILEALRSHDLVVPLERVSAEKLNDVDAPRVSYGYPSMYVLTFDDSSDPPLMQVELWPAPQFSKGLPVEYTVETPSLTSTSTTILPWVRPAALIEGVSADCCLWLGKESPGYLPVGDRHELRFEARVADMIRTESRNQPAEQLQMADRFIRHRQRRWQR